MRIADPRVQRHTITTFGRKTMNTTQTNHVFELINKSSSSDILADSGDEKRRVTKSTETVSDVASDTAV